MHAVHAFKISCMPCREDMNASMQASLGLGYGGVAQYGALPALPAIDPLDSYGASLGGRVSGIPLMQTGPSPLAPRPQVSMASSVRGCL